MKTTQAGADAALVAKHFRRARDLRIGDNAQGQIVVARPRRERGLLLFRVRDARTGAISDNLAWSPDAWIPLGNELPPREAHEALMRIEKGDPK